MKAGKKMPHLGANPDPWAGWGSPAPPGCLCSSARSCGAEPGGFGSPQKVGVRLLSPSPGWGHLTAGAAESCALAGEVLEEIRMGYGVPGARSFSEVNKTRQAIAAA